MVEQEEAISPFSACMPPVAGLEGDAHTTTPGESDMDRERIAKLIGELDELVPAADAEVRLTQVGGGPDESKVVATEIGYLRFGLVFMQAALAPRAGGRSGNEVDVDLSALVSDASDVSFHWFERVDRLSQARELSARQRLGDTVLSVAVFASCLAAAALLMVGLLTVLGWLFR